MFNSAFMNGFARTIDIGSSMSKKANKKLLSKSDSEALAKDWKVTGEDLRVAMKEYNDAKTAASK